MNPITDDLLGHVGVAGVVVWLIELLKRLNLPGLRWISQEKTRAAMVLSMVSAFAVSLGFQLNWDSGRLWEVVFVTGGDVTLTIPPNLPDLLVRAVGQGLLNVAAYHGAVKPVVGKAE
jgi:hypothetical protein